MISEQRYSKIQLEVKNSDMDGGSGVTVASESGG